MDFMTMIENAFLCGVFILGLNGLFAPGNILSRLGLWLSRTAPVWIVKPLFRCAFCMSSVWGSVWYTFIYPPGESVVKDLILWPLFCILVAGMVRLFMFIGNYDVGSVEV